MYTLVYTRQFKKSFKRIRASGTISTATLNKLTIAINTLARGQHLPTSYRAHQLAGAYTGYCECHIRGDLLLIYEIDKKLLTLTFVDIGTHAELF